MTVPKYQTLEYKKKCRINNLGKKNPRYGKHHSLQTRQFLSKIHLGAKNSQWKGDEVGYNALHDYIRCRLAKSSRCQRCLKETIYLDLANVSQQYLRNLNDWWWICRKCHMITDGRIEKLQQRNQSLESRINLSKKRTGKNNPFFGKHHISGWKKK